MAVRANRIIRVVVIIIVALATSLLLYLLINNFQFTRGRTVKVHFTSIGDLNNGSLVRRAGIKVGSVTRIEPAADEKSIILTLTFETGKIVRTGDQFALVSKGILGDMYIEQKPGAKDAPLVEEGQLFEGIPSFNIADLLTGDTMGMVTDLADSLKGVVQILKNNQDTLESSLKDIAATAHNVRIVTDRAVDLTRSVPDMTRQITTSIDQLQAAVTEVSMTTKRLMAKLEDNLTTSSDDLAASMKAVRRSSEEIQSSVSKLTAQNSVIARMGSADTAQSLDTTVKNLEEISRGLLTVTKDTQKIVTGISSMFDQK
jgi:phospholipid/cholesterol/gamma-HCH transport system substrate-binding protein